jgi:hypothetical protein
VLAATACSGKQGDPGKVPALSSDVKGTVTDGTNPLTGVAVSASPGGASTTTDGAGAFTLPSLALGAYTLTFHLAGYVDRTMTVAVNLSGPTQVTASLAQDPSTFAPPVLSVSDQLAAGYATPVSVKVVAQGAGPFTYAWAQTTGPATTLTGAGTDTISFTTADLPTAMGATQYFTPPALAYARFGVIGIDPDAACNYGFRVTVTDAHGLISTGSVSVDCTRPTSGLRNVPVGLPVYLQGDANLVTAPATPVCATNADCPTATSTCTAAKGTCGCTTDTDCGGATSGLYCKTGVCTAGCNILGSGNGCPRGFSCSATAIRAGSCAGPQTTWSWTLDLSQAPGSSAFLQGAGSQVPSFTPDVKGIYVATETVSGKSLEVYAGTWVGAMTPDYSPPTATCAVCHNDSAAPNVWTSWKATAHATALQRKIEGSVGSHFTESCLPCHTVGYDRFAVNGGFDDLEAASGWLFPATLTVGNWSTLVDNATLGPLAGIQCESCHGPQGQPNGGPHTSSMGSNDDTAARISWSSAVCGECHQESPNHYFPQQWAQPGVNWIGHSNRDVAVREGTYERMPASFVAATGQVIPAGNNLKYCARCHTAQGFARYAAQINSGEYAFLTNDGLPLNFANHPATGLELRAKGFTAATIEPQTCQACHDPHVSDPATHPFQLRIYEWVPALPNGLANVSGMGTGAICLACHNGRNGEHSDFVQNTIDFSTGKFLPQPTLVAFPMEHDGPQAEMMFGFNTYFMPRYTPSAHLAIADTCAGCHAKIATAFDAASHQGSNHSFHVDGTICASCHGEGGGAVDGKALQAANQASLDALRGLLASKMLSTIVAAINNVPASGNMVVAVRPYDVASDSYASNMSSYGGGALNGWVDLVAGTGTTTPGLPNIPMSVGYTFARSGSFLVVLNVPRAVTFQPTAAGAAPVTTNALAVSFTAIGTNQPVPSTLPGWPTAGNYFFSVFGPPSPATGTTTGTYPTVPQPAWLTATPNGVANVQTFMKAYWNLSVLNNDGTLGIHNPSFFNGVVTATTNALRALP